MLKNTKLKSNQFIIAYKQIILENIILEAKNEAIAKWGKTQEVIEYIEMFMNKNNGIRLKVSAPYNNIDYWHSKRTFIEFKEFIDNFQSSRSIKKEKKNNIQLTDDGNGKLIEVFNGYEIWFVNSADASKQLGRFYKGHSTNWCISTDNADYYWNHDHKNDTFYFLIREVPEGNEFDKLAFEYKATGEIKIWDLKNRKNTFKDETIINYMKEHFKWIDKVTDSERYFRTPNLKIVKNNDIENTVNVYGDIYLDEQNLNFVPWRNKFKIKELFGDLNLNYNNIEFLNDMPEIIHGDLNLCGNKLKELIGLPKQIDGNLDISDNPCNTENIDCVVNGTIIEH